MEDITFTKWLFGIFLVVGCHQFKPCFNFSFAIHKGRVEYWILKGVVRLRFKAIPFYCACKLQLMCDCSKEILTNIIYWKLCQTNNVSNENDIHKTNKDNLRITIVSRSFCVIAAKPQLFKLVKYFFSNCRGASTWKIFRWQNYPRNSILFIVFSLVFMGYRENQAKNLFVGQGELVIIWLTFFKY